MVWEYNFLNWILENLHGNDIIVQIVRYFTVLGDGAILWFTLSILLIAIKKYRQYGITFLLSLIVVGSLNELFKMLVARPRPFDAPEGATLLVFVETKMTPIFYIGDKGYWGIPGSYSFMSGHALVGVMLGTLLFLFDKRIGLPILIIGVLLGLSRLFLVVHYPTDVLVGSIMGLIFAFCFKWLHDWGYHRFARRAHKEKTVASN
jgi:undecaprenyl-diphosphatase